MTLRRRSTAVAALVAAALTLSACGGGDGGDKDSAATGQQGSGKKSVAQGSKESDEAKARTAAMGTDAAPGQFPRTVDHALGKTEIKAQPRRVVVLDVGELDNVVSLGIEPVGYAPTEGNAGIPSYLGAGAGGPKEVGTANNLNLEAIAALKPDLILGSEMRVADKYKALSAIAPTVLTVRPGYTWKENYLVNAAALDRTAQAKEKLAAYEAKADKLGADVGEPKPTITMLRHMPGEIRLYAQASFIGTVLSDVGLPRPANQQAKEFAVAVSPEEIDSADADWIFSGVYGDPKATKRDAALANPLWKNLAAVKEGRAKDVTEETWYLGVGVTAADEVLDDLRGFLVK
ncbi:ABC transporter substrate-binding protein [Streptomyces sp. NPDC004609]|uniref:ABC transporter substrate-binding protein n=1 Tax=Streptomyces sp. NPDC004609 TaxID=3364704 RepID=UPI0036914C65